jgi:hypothetical protein
MEKGIHTKFHGLFAGIFLEHQNAPEKKYNDLAIVGGYILPRQKGGFGQD